MKYITILCDGMADYPVEKLGNKTPMQAAKKPYMDMLAKKSKIGLIKTVADNLKPGSDVANLSILGYDPAVYHSGRSPLEAASIGIEMKPTDVSLRCNLVTLSDDSDYMDKTMIDYCAGDISTEDAKILIDFIQKELGNDVFTFFSGVSYRHCLIYTNGTLDLGDLTPPHDILGKKINNYLSDNKNAVYLIDMMKKSYDLLSTHPLNIERVKNGKLPANSIWLWGEGVSKQLTSFKDKYGYNSAVISAVDLIKGIGKLTKMQVLDVDGATGYIDTNFNGKAQAAITALETNDFVYIHLEAPDECGHRNEIEEKVKSIEMIDEFILKPILESIKNTDYKILICPDHATPLSLRTHTNDPVPFLIYNSTEEICGADCFDEECAKKSNIYLPIGHELIEYFFDIKTF